MLNSNFFLILQAKVNSYYFILQANANSPFLFIIQRSHKLKLDGLCTRLTHLTNFFAAREQDYAKSWPNFNLLGLIRNPFATIGKVVLSTQMKNSIHAPTLDQPFHRLSVTDLGAVLNP
jgi:hypothetical protein